MNLLLKLCGATIASVLIVSCSSNSPAASPGTTSRTTEAPTTEAPTATAPTTTAPATTTPPVTVDASKSSTTAIQVAGIAGATALSVGMVHACALLSGGTVSCWGDNSFGQLGGDHRGVGASVLVPGVSGATAIAAGQGHSCALLKGGSVACWGNNIYGQLGDGTNNDSTVPVKVIGVKDATGISVGGLRSCALLASRAVTCWGGGGPDLPSQLPRAIPEFSGATALAVGGAFSKMGNVDFACAVLSDNSVTCTLQTGISAEATALDVSSIVADVCAVLRGGRISCYSRSHSAIAGVFDIAGASAVGVGGLHACALLNDGSIKCWGDNTYGQLGDDTRNSSDTPLPVSGLSGATAVDLGLQHSCALLQDGTVSCWGDNAAGQLGF